MAHQFQTLHQSPLSRHCLSVTIASSSKLEISTISPYGVDYTDISPTDIGFPSSIALYFKLWNG
jgi:hypothetical protein